MHRIYFIFSLLLIFFFAGISIFSQDFLTEEEKNWIRENPVITLASTSDWPPFEELTEDGEYRGITVDIVQLAAEKVGLKIEPVFEKWPIELEMLKRGELDLAPGLFETEERNEYIKFTRSFITMNEILLINTNQSDITSMDDIVGKTVVVESGYKVHEILKRDFPDTKLLLVDSTLEALKKLSSSEADAYIGNQVVSTHLIKSHLLLNIKSLGFTRIPTTHLAMGVPKDRTILRDIMDKALASIDKETHDRIINKWIGSILEEDTASSLTREEKNWIKEYPITRIATVKNWSPYSETLENGSYVGFHIDLLEAINKEIGSNLKPIAYDSWPDAYENFVAGNTDVIISLSWTEERTKSFFFSPPYHYKPAKIILRSENTEITNWSDLGRKTILVKKHVSLKTKIEEDFPDSPILIMDTEKEALKALADGQGDAYFIWINTSEEEVIGMGLKIAFNVDTRLGEFTIGTRISSPVIASIIRKGLKSIPLEKMVKLKQKWMIPGVQGA